MILNRERFKSVTLLFLVILSFILTTRIWFNTSIEGIFIMSGNKAIKPEFNAEYDMSQLLKPHKLIVSFGERSILQYDSEENSETYNRIFKEAKRVIRTAVLVNSKDVVERVPVEELNRIRGTRGVSFIFNMPLEINGIYKLMNISSGDYIGIKSIDEIIISQSLNKMYMYDTVQNILYEFRTEGIQNNLDFMITSLEKLDTVTSLYLDKFDKFQPALYGKNAVVPTRMGSKGLPVLSGEMELIAGEGIPEEIAALFDAELEALSIIKNMDGTLVYTDRDNRVVKLYTNGMLEYVNYELQASDSKTLDVSSAIDVSTEFVSRHFGFPEDSYISDIIRGMRGDKYIIRYRYSFEGLPIVMSSGSNIDTIEVEIVGDQVKRYKRLVRTLHNDMQYKQVKNFRDILDILLDKKVETMSGEKIKTIKDMYLAYNEIYEEKNIRYVPVWVAEVTVERLENGALLNQRYILNAETGFILDK